MKTFFANDFFMYNSLPSKKTETLDSLDSLLWRGLQIQLKVCALCAERESHLRLLFIDENLFTIERSKSSDL